VGLEITIDVGQPGNHRLQKLFTLFRRYRRRPHLWVRIVLMMQHHYRDDRPAVVFAVDQFTPLTDRICTPRMKPCAQLLAGASPSSRSSNTGMYTFGSCSVFCSSVLTVFQ
jgi:hypothetical protein